jgi:hypothetical protein
METLRRWGPPAFLVAASLFVLQHAPWAGLHLDDHAFHHALASADWDQMAGSFFRYVPGRNLHILIQGVLYKTLGPDPVRHHVLGLILDTVCVLLGYAWLRLLGAPRAWATAVAGLFLVMPNHAETHYWLSALPMNLASTALIIAAFIAAAWRLDLAFLLWASALFTYDQAFFMWAPIAVYAAFFRSRRASIRALILFSSGAILLQSAHVLLRILSPISEGGRPTIRLDHIPLSVAESLLESLLPLRSLPPLDSLRSAVGGPAATIAVLSLLAAAWLHLSRRREERPPMGAFVVIGGLWWLCAYLPNYFWYVSPRHNFLPSLGLLAAAVAVADRFPSRALAVFGAAFFGLSAASTLAAGHAWRRTAGMQESFRQAATRDLPPGVDNVFLLGAPTQWRGAPAFQGPDEPSFLYAEAFGGPRPVSSLSLSPARTGAFFMNEADLFGRQSLRFRAYSGMNVFTEETGEFRCSSSLRIRPEGEGLRKVLLNSPPGCRANPSLDAPVWLLESVRTTAPVDSLIATGTWVKGSLELELLWKAAPRADFAAFPALIDSAGRIVFEPLYSLESGHSLHWPLYDDIQPPSLWKRGTGVRQRFRLRAPISPPPGPLRLRLTLLERRENAPWVPAGTLEKPLLLR